MKIKKTFNTDYQQYKNLGLYNFKVSRNLYASGNYKVFYGLLWCPVCRSKSE